MLIRFWGTRGSLPKPGPDTIRYGGNTSCVEIRSAAGTLVVIDCGTGAHGLGQALMAGPKPVRGHLLISHTHWDHIQGIPFFTPLFAPENEWDVYAPHSLSQSIRDTLAGQMQYTYFPVTLEALGATIRYHDLVEGVFDVGDIKVRSHYLNHPALTLGYRLEIDGRTIVYSCDHEPFARHKTDDPTNPGDQNRQHIDFLRDADLVIHDSQYTEQEYPDKIGWGHSTADYAVDVCSAAGVKQLALTHHDPWRTDDAVDKIVTAMRSRLNASKDPLQVFAAAEGQTIELESIVGTGTAQENNEFSAVTTVAAAISRYSILLGVTDVATAELITAAAAAESVQITGPTSTENALKTLEADSPALIIVDPQSAREHALSICRKAGELGKGKPAQTPIVVISDGRNTVTELAGLKVDNLVRPFSEVYARTRLRAWILRTTCKWVRARMPDNERERLAALKELAILDTEPEERFDRITRLAADALDVPVALVSLIDQDRQWFKSCIGADMTEAPRDMAFCAHAILEDDLLIVPDTFLDPRFADNPLVTGESRVRFYAGCPLKLPNGYTMGTLCLVDTRPRQLSDRQMNLLRELGKLAELELVK